VPSPLARRPPTSEESPPDPAQIGLFPDAEDASSREPRSAEGVRATMAGFMAATSRGRSQGGFAAVDRQHVVPQQYQPSRPPTPQEYR
jgi:hypothetical protein